MQAPFEDGDRMRRGQGGGEQLVRAGEIERVDHVDQQMRGGM